MPSNKPVIAIRLDEETKKKFEFIAKQKHRSASNLANYLITKEIIEYEIKNGDIEI